MPIQDFKIVQAFGGDPAIAVSNLNFEIAALKQKLTEGGQDERWLVVSSLSIVTFMAMPQATIFEAAGKHPIAVFCASVLLLDGSDKPENHTGRLPGF